MNSMITEEIVDMIRHTKAKMPAGWKITTIETEYYLILDIPMKEFEKFPIHDRIRIAEATNELCERIKQTGILCVIQKA